MKRRKTRVEQMVPTFVDRVPGQLVEGLLYVSLRYRTVTHLCACGCGVEVNTPLHPTGWQISYDGVAVTLSPSVGNWGEECRSHYLIEKNLVRWSRSWSRAEILDGRAIRRHDIRKYYDDKVERESKLDREGVDWTREPRHRLRAVIAFFRRRWSTWRGR